MSRKYRKMHHNRRKGFDSKPLRYLKQLREDLDTYLGELERGPRRDIDIATEFDNLRDITDSFSYFIKRRTLLRYFFCDYGCDHIDSCCVWRDGDFAFTQ